MQILEKIYSHQTQDSLCTPLHFNLRIRQIDPVCKRSSLSANNAVEGREKELGVNHPDTLTIVYNLAFLLASKEAV
jgi:hypothetical protein